MLTRSPATSTTPAAATESPPATPLEHMFRAIIFDWDGTAVADRLEDAHPLARLIELLLDQQVWIVVVTGTNFDNINRQFCQLVTPARRRHLLVCCNRGSEVYGFDDAGEVVRRWLRVSTPEEEAALTAVAEQVRDRLTTTTGLDIQIVYDRLNRRKIDLIPLPEWADPPKARIGQLLVAVEERLHRAGLAGGIREAIGLAEELALEHGLHARITSDVKHIEIGLTDKGDSLAWIKRELLAPEGIAMSDVLIVGDEFGAIAGFAGSDDRLRQDVDGAVVVSVGPEPNGVPEGVLHLGGGPAQFRALLADQECLRHAHTHPQEFQTAWESWIARALRPPLDRDWRLDVYGYQPALEHSIESRFAISNGYIGTRGSLSQVTSASRPRTFIAGLYDQDNPSGIPALAMAPDWLRYRLLVEGRPLNLETGELLTLRRTLDMRRGLLLTEWLHCNPEGRSVRMRTMRFASRADRHLGVQVLQVESARPLQMRLDAAVHPTHDGLIRLPGAKGIAVWHPAHANNELALAMSASLHVGARLLPGEPLAEEFGDRWEWQSLPGSPSTFVRIVAMADSRSDGKAAAHATATLRQWRVADVQDVLSAHVQAWARRWDRSDVVVDGDHDAQRALRFALYHLNSAADPEDEHVSIGARALTGEAYQGHIFWDTEIFALPFYTFTWPEAARALLMYRYHTLPAARAKAARLGYRGALYAWESADTGDDVTPALVAMPNGQVVPVKCGTIEQHISADIAYAAWQYWQATGDEAFLRDAGAEIVLETARFWSSRAALEGDGRYHIRQVIGPDEYHEDVDDNAYTNLMARWNLERGIEVAALLRQRWGERWTALSDRLALDEPELAHWREVADQLAVSRDAESGRIEQFTGFFGLEQIDLRAYAQRRVPLDVLLGRERIQHAQVLKQADVVMLLALLWEQFTPEERTANFRYYEPRCGHGSSLSPAMHALVAARLGDTALAERYFRQTAAIDLDDTMSNAALGVHIAALGGLWQAAVLGFGGLQLRADGVRLDPHLPESWQALRFPLQWHGGVLRVSIERRPLTMTLALEGGEPCTVYVGSLQRQLGSGETWRCLWDEPDQRWKEEPL
jgi:trehalose/maltose hydrolase-like predicted phosphorylase